MKKNMVMSIGCLMLAGLLGCAYEPDNDRGLGYRIRESPQYALAPNARWTCLHYCFDGGRWGSFLDMQIFLDSHRIKFTRVEPWLESHKISHDRIVTEDEWRWIVGQLEKAGVSRWKKSYHPDGVVVVDGVAWYLEFLDGSNIVGEVIGDNAWPKNFNAFRAIVNAFDVAPNSSCVVIQKATEEKATSPQ